MNTVTADELSRVVLPNCNPGDRFAVSTDNEGVIVLKRVLESDDGVPLVQPIWDDNFLIAPTVPQVPVDYAGITRQERDSQ